MKKKSNIISVFLFKKIKKFIPFYFVLFLYFKEQESIL